MILKKRIVIPSIIIVITISIMSIMTYATAGTEYYRPQVKHLSSSHGTNVPAEGNSIKVITLNIAHGRKDSFHQALEKESTLKKNLDDIAAMLKREAADVAAFQEIDAASSWNGGYNQAEYLAAEGDYSYAVLGRHVSGMNLNYGTALISKQTMTDPLSVRFDQLPPFLTKGFVLSTVNFPGSDRQVDVISLHLAPIGAEFREKQIKKVINTLKKRTNPLIIMGDFNCDWGRGEEKSAVNYLAENLQLKTFKPETTGLETFKEIGNKRLDWILISEQLNFISYRVIEDRLSDHSGVISEITLNNNGNHKICNVSQTANESIIRSSVIN